jgi:hypothetical protein
MMRIVKSFVAPGCLLALATAGVFVANPVIAASPNVEAAIKSIAKIEMDATKFQSFCKLIKDLDDVPETDTAKADALEAQLDSLLKSIGLDVFQAWDLGSDLNPESDDGKAFEAAVEALEEKCP